MASTRTPEYRALRAMRRATWPVRTATLVRSARARARRKALPFDLTKEWLAKRLRDIDYRCELTGRLLKLGRPTDRQTRPDAPSLDRIDPSKGYVTTNVRVLCHQANTAKGEGTDEELLSLARALLGAAPT